MRTFEIFTCQQFKEMVRLFEQHFLIREEKGLPFPKLTIISKAWRKPKSSAQHKKYWAVINELKNAFEENGMVYNQEVIHELVKRESGFTKMVELPSGRHVMVNKSIADQSEDVNSKEINFLIAFVQQFAAEHLGRNIDGGIS